jgi:BirA family biotin operon repressor/biotin-[acetyl-CoA-carboxylase] ligase
MAEYRTRNLVPGKAVTVHPINGEPYPAKALDIDDRGRLVVEWEQGTIILDSGEVSVRF